MTPIEHIRVTGEDYYLHATRNDTGSRGSWTVEENAGGTSTDRKVASSKMERWCGKLLLRGARTQNTTNGLYIQCGDEIEIDELCA